MTNTAEVRDYYSFIPGEFGGEDHVDAQALADFDDWLSSELAKARREGEEAGDYHEGIEEGIKIGRREGAEAMREQAALAAFNYESAFETLRFKEASIAVQSGIAAKIRALAIPEERS